MKCEWYPVSSEEKERGGEYLLFLVGNELGCYELERCVYLNSF